MILVLTAIALGRTPEAQSTALWRVLFRQGISYFVVACIVNVLVVVCVGCDISRDVGVNVPIQIFAWLNLNGAELRIYHGIYVC